MASTNSRLERIAGLLVCPACRGELALDDGGATCSPCSARYPIANGRIYFRPVPDRGDALDDLKGRLKRVLGKYYYTVGVNLLAPTFPFAYRRTISRYADAAREVVVDAGCGNHRVDDDFIGVDIFDYDAVDVVCDLTALPFRSGTVDAVVTRSVIEHIPSPAAAVGEFYRCTRPGGLALHLVPFLFPFHASPHDYQRFTHKGLETLFGDFDGVRLSNATGPVTLLLVAVIEFLAIVLSLGVERAKAPIYLALCAVLFPIKFLDAPFVARRSFLTMAPTILVIARKPYVA